MQHFLREKGYDAEQILVSGKSKPDIREYSIPEIGSIIFRRLRRLLWQRAKLEDVTLSGKRAKKYREYMRRTISVSEIIYNDGTISKIEGSKDIWIAGSDQIWNPKWWNGAYLLEFTDHHKKIAYAASIGVDTMSERKHKRLKRAVRSIPYISVREKSASEFLSSTCGVDAVITIDPVLLLNASEWDSVCEPIEIPKKYILCYFLSIEKDTNEKIKLLQASFGTIDVVIVAGNTEVLHYYECDFKNVLFDINPGNYLHLAKNAAVILTDSFHGVVFSILYHKEFYYILKLEDKQYRNNRIENLLDCLSIVDRNVCDIDNEIKPIHWPTVEAILQQEISNSANWLMNAIRELSGGKD